MPLTKTEVIRAISKESERDKQYRVGPSSIGNPCPYCLGHELMGTSGQRDFSLLPWVGTAVHGWMERETFPDAEHELRLYVGDIDGYGRIVGTTDLYDPRDGGTVVDWKVVGKKKIQEYRLKGPKTQYRYQAQLYARGAELSGRPVAHIQIVFIPRDSDGDPQGIWIHTEDYQPAMAEAALERAGTIYHKALNGETLPSHKDCYECRINGRL